LFTPDGVYHDYIYGPHKGRASIADMLENLFHRDAGDYHWEFRDPVVNGNMGYARSLSRFVSTISEFKGRKVVNGGVAQAQLGVAPERMAKVMKRWSDRFLSDPEVADYSKGFKS
jgi:hypothetical protein